jgi:hypothetical protein
LQQWSHASTIDAADRPNQVRYALRPGSKVPHRDGPDIVTDTPDAAQEKVSQMLRDADAEAGGRPGRRPGTKR